MKNVLLTGGAGFIGSHTAVEFLNKGYNAIILDNFSNSNPNVINNISQITNRQISCYNVDVSDRSSLEKVFIKYNIDAVVHFAGYKAVGESVKDPLLYYRNNIDTTLTLLEAMSKYNVRKFIFSSSATVYGEQNAVPYSENSSTGDCTNPYGRTKFFIEEIIKDVAKADNGFSAVILRYFNPIGAHESGLIGELPNGIPNNLLPYITQTANGTREQLNVFGNDYPTIDGTGVRDYIHVVDLAKGHVSALEYADKHAGIEIFNLGTGKGYSVLEIVNAFEKSTGQKIPYVITSRRDGDIAESYADIKKAELLLGWKATKEIEDMCKDAWRWQKNCNK